DVFLRRLRRPAARARFLLDRVALAGIGLAITGIFETFHRSHRDPEQIGRPFAEEALLEPMAERTLPLADGPLCTAGPDRSEDDLLAKVRAFLHRHLADIRGLLLDRRRIGFHLRQPVPEPGETGRHKEHEPT